MVSIYRPDEDQTVPAIAAFPSTPSPQIARVDESSSSGPYGAAMIPSIGGITNAVGKIARAYSRGASQPPLPDPSTGLARNQVQISALPDPSIALGAAQDPDQVRRMEANNAYLIGKYPTAPAVAAPTIYAGQGDPGRGGFGGRGIIRAGAAPGTPQGAGGAPGAQIQSDYGYGDQITATADGSGRFNSFSGVGGSGNQTNVPRIADYASGLARAAADRERLAQIEAEKNAIPVPVIAMGQYGQRGDERLGTTGGGAPLRVSRLRARIDAGSGTAPAPAPQIDPNAAIAQQAALTTTVGQANSAIQANKAAARAASARIVDAAQEQPFKIAAEQAGTAATQAKTGLIGAETGEAAAKAKLTGAQAGSAELSLKGQKDLDALRSAAISTGKPEDMEAYSQAVRAQAGKGGNLTQEDLVKAYTEYLVAHTKANAMSPTAPTPLDFQTFTQGIHGKLTINNDPRAAAIKAQVDAGKLKRDDAKAQLAALGYQ